MSKPWIHALSSAKKYGGTPELYLPIHDFMDISKSAHADVRHRVVLHNALGIFIAERVFGHNISLSDGKLVSVRDIAEDHVKEDLGRIPSLTDWLNTMAIRPWMAGRVSRQPPAAPSLDNPPETASLNPEQILVD